MSKSNIKGLVSIITPAYNAEKYLSETIDSVKNQTYSEWEMLIVDDCSEDNTLQIASKAAENDNRIRVIRHASNLGVAAARNSALAEARGRYIAFLDSDDKWSANKLEEQLAFMEKGHIAFSYTGYETFDIATGRLIKKVNAKKVMTASNILSDTRIGCLTVMVDIDAVGKFEMPLINHCEDNCTWHLILKRGFYAYGLNKTLAFYRVGNESLSSKKFDAAVKQWKVYREYYKFSRVYSSWLFVQYAFRAFLRHYAMRDTSKTDN